MIHFRKQILKTASKLSGVPTREICSSSRKIELVFIRDAVAAAIKQSQSASDLSIAELLCRDRSAITFALKRHENRMKTAPNYAQFFGDLMEANRND